MFGNVIINNGEINKTIRKDQEIPTGFEIGMVKKRKLINNNMNTLNNEIAS